LFFPASGDRDNLVKGLNRYVYSFASVLLVIGCYKFRQYDMLPKFVTQPLAKLGVATYGIYLLHPIVSLYFGDILKKLQMATPFIRTGSTIVLVIFFSLLSYYLFEANLIMVGKRITAELIKNRASVHE
jgi:exopolysaccharide production protein ExoZ